MLRKKKRKKSRKCPERTFQDCTRLEFGFHGTGLDANLRSDLRLTSFVQVVTVNVNT
jgi:hypothetical protein